MENKKPGRIRRKLLKLIAGLLLLMGLVSVVESSVVTLEMSDVTLRDLPPAFDGLRIVYVSDLNVNTLNPLERMDDLMQQLGSLKPDLILLGGDYCCYDPLVGMNQSRDAAFIREAERRDELFAALSTIQTEYGIFAVAGERDNQVDEHTGITLEQSASLGGVKVLRDDWVTIRKNGKSLILAGVDDWKSGGQALNAIAKNVSKYDCVILLSHNPDAVPALATRNSLDGGEWIDLALSGHLMGGRMTLMGHGALINPSIYADRFRDGWYLEGSTKLLISRGVGSAFLPLRFFSTPQAHLITLHCER